MLAAPLIDKGSKKRWIVGLDLLLVLVYAFMGIWILNHEFQYGLYLAMTLAVGTISVFYRLAYGAWYPELIPAGFEQKGYAVSGTIYPMIIIVMSPAATFLYEKVSMQNLFFLVAALTMLSVVIESMIEEHRPESKAGCADAKSQKDSYFFKQYKADVREGFSYLKKEKGIRNIYTYMSVTQGVSEGTAIAIQAFYQTQPGLTVTMLGFLKSAEMIGRVLSGALQYRIEIPAKKRYGITKFVYIFYQLADMLLLFVPYPLMLINRFLCGGLGTMSATLRETAVQSYLPGNIRARVNAVFHVFFAAGGIFFQFFAGALGEVLPYRATVLLMGAISLLAIRIFIVKPDRENRPVYEAIRDEKNKN